MKRCNLVLLILFAFMLWGHGIVAGQEAHSGAIVNPNMRIPLPPQAMADRDMTVVAHASNTFAFDLYTRLSGVNGGNDNLFFCPYSLNSALSMTYLGARGQTAQEMLPVLGFHFINKAIRSPAEDRADVESSYAALNHSLSADVQKDVTLSIANALWAQKGDAILPDYLDAVKKDFDADLTPVDFAGQTEACRTQINDWVAARTHDKIKDLLLPGVVTSNTKLVLTNAIYFKGKWSDPFDAGLTTQGDFNCFAGQLVKADMMHASAHYSYAEDDLCQAVRLPYGDGQLAMLVLLPKVAHPTDADRSADPQRQAVEKLQGSLTDGYLQRLTRQLADRRVKLTLPKWHATQAFDLGQTLADMGMKLAFSGDADFSGINGGRGLSLSDVVHKAFVDVDEEGTEAAAASAAAMPGGFEPPPQPPVEFTADHPFIYLIIHVPSSTILFTGRLCDPSQGK